MADNGRGMVGREKKAEPFLEEFQGGSLRHVLVKEDGRAVPESRQVYLVR
jgi:hypothetical protein